MRYLNMLVLPCLLLFGCGTEKFPEEVLGYAPVYADSSVVKQITFETPRATENAGKIYSYENLAFQVETGKGIHVINKENPATSSKIGFITVYGCSELSIRNNMLYTNNMNDLISIDIENLNQVKLVSRVSNVFPGVSQQSPPQQGAYFECVDPEMGTVIGWTEKLLQNPKCKR